jgi:hypothetical protein
VVTTNDHDVIDAARRNGWRHLVLEAGKLGDRVRATTDAGNTAPNVVQFPIVAAAGGQGE